LRLEAWNRTLKNCNFKIRFELYITPDNSKTVRMHIVLDLKTLPNVQRVLKHHPSRQSSIAYIVMDVPNTVYVDINVFIHDDVRSEPDGLDQLVCCLWSIKTSVH
jgi:hypothetical protein